MARTVHCRKYGEELEGLDAPPFFGAASANRAGVEKGLGGIAQQTRLINEKHLNMMEPESRKYLSEQRELFPSGGAADDADRRSSGS